MRRSLHWLLILSSKGLRIVYESSMAGKESDLIEDSYQYTSQVEP